MCDSCPESETGPARESPRWLVFVSRAADDGPWLRLMVLNPLNGDICPLLNVAADADAKLDGNS